MSIRGLKKMALLLTFWVALQGRGLRADQTITGNLTVTGSNVYMGEQTSTTNPGWGTIYTDGTNSTVEFQGTRSGNTWEWQQSDGTIVQMTLNTTNTLTLYNQSGTAEITLNPTGTSSFAGSVTISGTDNEMPNQTLVNSNSVLTEGLGDSRYASSSLSSVMTIGSGWYWGGWAPTISLNGGVATTGAFSFAEGPGSTASDYFSMAMGEHATASGQGSTALGIWNWATGFGSTALGLQTVASGQASTALGNTTTASGVASTASGYYSIASGLGSTALGWRTTASNYGSTALGYYSTASGSSATALGYFSTASGPGSTALGAGSTANGNNSRAFGNSSTASGNYSTSMGAGSTASGWASVALGFNTTASGPSSTALGYDTTASGYFSTASGLATTAQAYDSFVIGTYNVGGGNETSWEASDPLFEIGNGTSSTNTSDALVVYKNGNAAVQGSLSAASLSSTSTVTAPAYITTTQTGDIPMFAGY